MKKSVMKKIAKDLKAVAQQLENLSRTTERIIMVVDRTSSSTTPKTKKAVSVTPTDQVLIIMKRFKNGISVTSLKEKSGFNEKQISNIVHRACKKGVIKRVRRGVYSLYGEESKKSPVIPESMDFY